MHPFEAKYHKLRVLSYARVTRSETGFQRTENDETKRGTTDLSEIVRSRQRATKGEERAKEIRGKETRRELRKDRRVEA